MMVHEGAMLVIVNRRIAAGKDLPAWGGTVNLLAETLFPTLALLWFTESPLLGPYRALVAPANLTYFFFILLSTLRLNPSLSRWTGLLSGAGYLAVAVYTFARYPAADPLFAGSLRDLGSLIVLGLSAARWLGNPQTCGCFLQEAETRRQMERIQQDLDTARGVAGPLEQARFVSVRHCRRNWPPQGATGGDYLVGGSLPPVALRSRSRMSPDTASARRW
jgi:hypothetical protein